MFEGTVHVFHKCKRRELIKNAILLNRIGSEIN